MSGPAIKVSELLSRFKGGETYDQLAKRFDLSSTGIRNRLFNLMGKKAAKAQAKLNLKAAHLAHISDRDQQILRLFRRGQRESAIARKFETSRQRVEQVLYRRLGRSETMRLRGEFAEARRDERVLARWKARQERRRMVEALGFKCAICYGPVDRMRGEVVARTCSPRCRQLWGMVRYNLDEGTRQSTIMSRAKAIVSGTTKSDPLQLSWAKRKLKGEARTYRLRERSPRVLAALQEVERLRKKVLDGTRNVA